MRGMRMAASFLITITVVAGPPAAALWWWQHAGWPWPARAQLDAWVNEPLTAASLAIMLGLLATAVWLTVVITVLATATRQWRHAWQRLKRLPIPTPAQATATSMAGAAVFGVPAFGLTSTATEAGAGTPDLPLPSALQHPGSNNGSLRMPMAPGPGVDLPDGGWLPPETAQSITIAAGLGWLRRRRDYRPSPPPADHPDVQELPHTIAVIQDQAPTGSVDVSDAGPAVLGRRAGAPLRLDELPATGVGLSGPGAAHAARGVLITALLSPSIAAVVTTRHDITHLLGDIPVTLGDLPGLHVAGNLRDAVDRLERLGKAQTGLRTALVTTVPQQVTEADRLRGALGAPHTTAVLLGVWPHGANRCINIDGTTTATGLEAERWCVLGMQATADLCVLAAHASGSSSTRSAQVPARVGTPASAAAQPESAAAAELALRVLGSPALTVRGAAIRLRRSAAVQALVLLAVHRDGVTTRQLGTALWPAEGPHATSSRVYTTMSELRRTLTVHTGASVVLRDSDRYRLDPDHIGVDLWDLEAAVTASIILRLGGEDPSAAYRRVVDGYTGELAAGQGWPWLDPHRERLRHHVLDVCIGLAEGSTPADRPAILQRAHDVDNCSEDILRRLMTTLAQRSSHERITELAAAHRIRLAVRGLSASADFDAFVANLLPR